MSQANSKYPPTDEVNKYNAENPSVLMRYLCELRHFFISYLYHKGINSLYTENMKEQPVRERMYSIDVLRAIATVIIVVTHVLQYHLHDFLTTFVWNYIHFAVVLFVFCSVSVLLPAVERMEMNVASLFAWCKKRFWRLIKPFYVYIAAHALLILLLPSIFNGNGLKLTPRFLLDSITLSGGINFNWLVLLFIEIALVFPLIYKVSQKKKQVNWMGKCIILFYCCHAFHARITLYIPPNYDYWVEFNRITLNIGRSE